MRGMGSFSLLVPNGAALTWGPRGLDGGAVRSVDRRRVGARRAAARPKKRNACAMVGTVGVVAKAKVYEDTRRFVGADGQVS